MTEYVTELPEDAVPFEKWEGHELYFEYWVSPTQGKVYKRHDNERYHVLKITDGKLSLRFAPGCYQKQGILIHDIVQHVLHPPEQPVQQQQERTLLRFTPPATVENDDNEEEEDFSELDQEFEYDDWTFWTYGHTYRIIVNVRIVEIE